jgi:hypothetical protein
MTLNPHVDCEDNFESSDLFLFSQVLAPPPCGPPAQRQGDLEDA